MQMAILSADKKSQLIKAIFFAVVILELMNGFSYVSSHSDKRIYSSNGVIRLEKFIRYKNSDKNAKQIILVMDNEQVKFICRKGRNISCFDQQILNKIKDKKVTAKWQTRDIFFKQLISIKLESGESYIVDKKYYKKPVDNYFRNSVIRFFFYLIIFCFFAFKCNVNNQAR